ncbi:6781_t:CDS:2, partial [Funneliformis geosporum]
EVNSESVKEVKAKPKANEKPNDDEGIYKLYEMYLKDIDLKPILAFNN